MEGVTQWLKAPTNVDPTRSATPWIQVLEATTPFPRHHKAGNVDAQTKKNSQEARTTAAA